MNSCSEGNVYPHAPPLRGSLPPEGAVRALGRPGSARLLWRVLRVTVLLSASFLSSNGALALVEPTHVAITTVADFDATTWKKLLRKGSRPAAYVFTNSFCATCPEAFDLLHKTVAASGKSIEVAAILMDVQGGRALAHAHHYAGVTSLYAFDGFEPAIRQAVDPQWRNVTPYVVLVGRNGRIQRVTGQPNTSQLKAWLQPPAQR